ncbi:MAG: PhoX family phosphatase [Pseudomonadota bacterium]
MTKKQNESPTFQHVLSARMSRRQLLTGMGYTGAALALAGCSVNSYTRSASQEKQTNESVKKAIEPSSLSFKEVPHGLDELFTVPQGYSTQVLVRWGDPLFLDAPEFDPNKQTEEAQLQQFGFNNDFVGYVPLPLGSSNSNSGLLVVNHEYVRSEMMFPGSPNETVLTPAQAKINMASHGLSIVEIRKGDNEQWQTVLGSKHNRRITPNTTMAITGPASGSERLKTNYSRDGIKTFGTYGNCSGGVTPWGTILTGEENIDYMFGGDYRDNPERENYERFGMHSEFRGSWGLHDARFDMTKTPAEPLHVGWVVEIDPYDPTSTPKKRTALGRFKHEGANVFINTDGHVVAYTGDDQRFEYLYRFVSKNKYQPSNREANLTLLEEGTLYCAKFEDDGSVKWLAMVHDEGPLTSQNGFNSQADVQIDCRKAADLLGATPMDRPEDVEVNPQTGHVYVMLTNNHKRDNDQTDGPNPRPNNNGGQVLELTPPDGNHNTETFSWDLILVCGPKDEQGTKYHPAVSDNGWLACPDNCAFDALGNLWISSDGAKAFGVADGVWATEVSGEFRGLTKRFLRAPIGAEMCGPFFTPDAENFFSAVQHPGEGSTFDVPSTRWPDFRPDMPPRPSVVVITKDGGGRIGS